MQTVTIFGRECQFESEVISAVQISHRLTYKNQSVFLFPDVGAKGWNTLFKKNAKKIQKRLLAIEKE